MSNVNDNPERLELGAGESIHKSVMEFKEKDKCNCEYGNCWKCRENYAWKKYEKS
jgi:hypothetical protein